MDVHRETRTTNDYGTIRKERFPRIPQRAEVGTVTALFAGNHVFQRTREESVPCGEAPSQAEQLVRQPQTCPPLVSKSVGPPSAVDLLARLREDDFHRIRIHRVRRNRLPRREAFAETLDAMMSVTFMAFMSANAREPSFWLVVGPHAGKNIFVLNHHPRPSCFDHLENSLITSLRNSMK